MSDKATSETVRRPKIGDIVHFVLGVEADGQPNINSGRHLAALVVHLYPNPNFSAGEPIPSLRIGVVGVPGCAPINDFVPFSAANEDSSNLIHDEITCAPGTWHFADDTTITAIAGFDPARSSGKGASPSDCAGDGQPVGSRGRADRRPRAHERPRQGRREESGARSGHRQSRTRRRRSRVKPPNRSPSRNPNCRRTPTCSRPNATPPRAEPPASASMRPARCRRNSSGRKQ